MAGFGHLEPTLYNKPTIYFRRAWLFLFFGHTLLVMFFPFVLFGISILGEMMHVGFEGLGFFIAIIAATEKGRRHVCLSYIYISYIEDRRSKLYITFEERFRRLLKFGSSCHLATWLQPLLVDILYSC